MRVPSRLLRRPFLEELDAAHHAVWLQFLGEYAELANARAFAASLALLKQSDWAVYAKRPFRGPAAVLAYLSRYTPRVAIPTAACSPCRKGTSPPLEGLPPKVARSTRP